MQKNEYELGELLSYEQPTQYIVKSTEYSDKNKIPVLTAGKSFILGYTNEESGIYDKLPVIIFDDFTTASRYVDFKFKVKSSAMKILTPNTELVLPKYIYYYMQVIQFDSNTHKRYWIQEYSKIKVQIPSLEMQKSVVSKIEELFSELDKGVETLKKIKEQTDVYKQAVLNEAFIECDNIKVNKVCSHITDGDHMPPPKSTKGIPFIMISNIKNNKIDWNNTNYVNIKYYNSIGEKRTPKFGDILYTVTGSYGIPVKVDFHKQFCFQRHIALLRPNKYISQDFLFYALQAPNTYKQASKRATGTAQKTVGLNILRDLDIPYTELADKQSKIVLNIKHQFLFADGIEEKIKNALKQSEILRQSILKRAFEGRLT